VGGVLDGQFDALLLAGQVIFNAFRAHAGDLIQNVILAPSWMVRFPAALVMRPTVDVTVMSEAGLLKVG
jgi:hypothetical protein